MKYAAKTEVSAEKSRAEIEIVLKRYGASRFGYMVGPTEAMIAFEARNRRIRFIVPMPDPTDEKYHYRKVSNYSKKRLTPDQAQERIEQEGRQRWRALLLAIKAKLEAVETGISTFEDEFLPHIVLPSGQTVGQWIGPQIDEAYRTGGMPQLLIGDGKPQ